MKLDFKIMVKASAACILLTLLGHLFDRFTGSHIQSRADVELVFAWIIVGIGWCVYLFGRIRSRRKDRDSEYGHKTGKDPW